MITARLSIPLIFSINDYESALEAFGKDCLANRPEPFIFTLFGGETGMTSWNGDLWKEHRRFALRTLRTLGVGKPEMENLISEEIESLNKQFEAHNGQPLIVRNFLAPNASNIVFTVMNGYGFNEDDPFRKQFTEFFATADLPSFPFTGYLVNYVKVAKTLFGIAPVGRDAKKKVGYFRDWAVRTVDEHEATYDKENPRDFIDHYLEECNNPKNVHFSS